MLNFTDQDVATLKNSNLFDEQWYIARYPDVAQLKMDPVQHYLWIGAELGRDPSPKFSTSGYLQFNPDVAAHAINPFLHYVTCGQFETRQVPNAAAFMRWEAPEATFVERAKSPPLARQPVRMIAFYLPQFHPIAENDLWWGEGFTEWTNVRPAKPAFIGHYQPHVPHTDVGHYDLSSTDAQKIQIELAKQYGISGFCFYYYWFAGKRLLEKPIENYLNDPSLDHPFCLCWANENWSRRWDGLDSEVLIAQDHSPEDDLGCIADLGRYIRDPRYIRVDGKPLVMIYRPSLLPSAKETADRWRDWCRENGIGEIYLCYTQSFETIDPSEIGFDAAIEFPPNNSNPPNVTASVVPTAKDFSGNVYDWDVFLARSQGYTAPDYKLFRSVCPGWDNTARRKAGGTTFVNNTPEKYRSWLENAIDDTVRRFDDPDERIVFVNAWNEWAEGAHLEPDCETGYAYLEATRSALAVRAKPQNLASGRKLVIVSHDAYRHGAQYLALNLARAFTEDLGYEVHVIMLGDGPLKPDFAKWATVHDLSGFASDGPEAVALARRLAQTGIEYAICNTAVSGRIVPVMRRAGFKITSLIHEQPKVIEQYGLEQAVRSIADLADHVIFPAPIVADGFEQFTRLDPAKRIIKPQGLYKLNALGRSPAGKKEARARLRERFGIEPDAPIILGVGYSDKRKGIDLYVEAGVRLLEQCPAARFIWLGSDAEPEWMEFAKSSAVAAGVLDRFVFPGFDEDTDTYYAGSDVFALTSREDPFPSVTLYAFDCGLPVVAFANTGGMNDVIEACGGLNVQSFDVEAYANALLRAIIDKELRAHAAASGPDTIDRQFLFRRYVQDLAALDANPLPRVSVIVPNYNYANYIVQRLNSVRDQTFPVYELIVLDDKSSDASVERIEETISDYRIPTVLVVNEKNSGSVFKQWQSGVNMATGDLIWIAEADDLAEPDFLATLAPAFDDPDVVLAYCQSRQIDGEGKVLSENYLDYVSDLGAQRWQKPYVARDHDEISTALFLKNVIPNVSAVVFRRQALQAVLAEHSDEILSYRNAGDWVVYIRMHERGAVAFEPASLNSHRRHQSSVTIGNSNQLHLDEIIKVQTETIARFKLGNEAEARAQAYSRKVAVQFGLAE